jgi:hypothetical protein
MAKPTMRDIPRVWEVDWAVPAEEGGTLWEAYDWLLSTAEELGETEVSIVAATYDTLGRIDRAVGSAEAGYLRVLPHSYVVDGITVHGVSRRGGWYTTGPVLVAWGNDQVLAEVEGHRPSAIAAVAEWPDRITGWSSAYKVQRIGQVRADQEAEFSTAAAPQLAPAIERAVSSGAAYVNEHHSVLSSDEREAMAGRFVALRKAGLDVNFDALRTYLMTAGWNGKLVGRTVRLAEEVSLGKTPRHRTYVLPE